MIKMLNIIFSGFFVAVCLFLNGKRLSYMKHIETGQSKSGDEKNYPLGPITAMFSKSTRYLKELMMCVQKLFLT